MPFVFVVRVSCSIAESLVFASRLAVRALPMPQVKFAQYLDSLRCKN